MMRADSLCLLMDWVWGVREREDLERLSGDFPGGSVAKTLRSQGRGPGFNP